MPLDENLSLSISRLSKTSNWSRDELDESEDKENISVLQKRNKIVQKQIKEGHTKLHVADVVSAMQSQLDRLSGENRNLALRVDELTAERVSLKNTINELETRNVKLHVELSSQMRANWKWDTRVLSDVGGVCPESSSQLTSENEALLQEVKLLVARLNDERDKRVAAETALARAREIVPPTDQEWAALDIGAQVAKDHDSLTASRHSASTSVDSSVSTATNTTASGEASAVAMPSPSKPSLVSKVNVLTQATEELLCLIGDLTSTKMFLEKALQQSTGMLERERELLATERAMCSSLTRDKLALFFRASELEAELLEFRQTPSTTS